MAGLPHDGPAAVCGYIVVEYLRTLNLADDGGAGTYPQDKPGEEEQQHIPPEDLALIRDDAETVGIAVISDPHIGLFLFYQGDQLAQVFGNCRVREVVGEPPLRLTVY